MRGRKCETYGIVRVKDKQPLSFNLIKNQLVNSITGRSNRMPELVGETWLNTTAPLTFLELRGRVILIDFWTYSCINCLRTFPYLKDWWRKYKDLGLIMIGIHTPEFEFEQVPANVAQAIRDLGIEWPILLDNEQINWQNFNNQYWPAKYLADRHGNIVYSHFGEGNYAETEKAIQDLLQDQAPASDQTAPIELKNDEHAHGNVCFVPTSETYCGYEKGPLINPDGYFADQTTAYQLPPEVEWIDGTIGLRGRFTARPEYIESVDNDSTLLLSFHATEVNLVLHPVPVGTGQVPSTQGSTVEIRLDHQPLSTEIRGVGVNEQNEVVIDQPRMYNLIRSETEVRGVLEIKSKQGRFQAYAFTFSGCR